MLGNHRVSTSDTEQTGVPIDYENAIQMLMNRYDAPHPENNEENLESYSIRAKKFKEIQFLREMNAKNSSRPEYKTMNSESYRQPLFDITGDEEPIKPRSSCNIDEKETIIQENYLNEYKLNNKANSDKDPHHVNENKLRQKAGKQSFRVKKESESFMQNFFLSSDNSRNNDQPIISKKEKNRLNKHESSKLNSLKEIYKTTTRAQTTNTIRPPPVAQAITDNENKETARFKDSYLPPKPQKALDKKRPQSKEAGRHLFLPGVVDQRPHTTNQPNTRIIIKRTTNYPQGNFLPDAVTPKKSYKEIDEDGIYETLNLSANTSPFNNNKQNPSKAAMSQNDLDAKVPQGFQTIEGALREGSAQGSRRMVQPLFNKTFAVSSQSETKEKKQTSQERRISSFLERNVPKTGGSLLKTKSSMIPEEKEEKVEENNNGERLSNLVKTGMDFQELPNEEGVENKKRESSVPKKVERRVLSPPKVAQIKTNNNMKVEQLIRGKKTFNHGVNMSEYLKRRGLKENTKVFCFNSRDEHIKRALKRFGWVENPHPSSFLFDLKWTYTDVEADYADMMDGQYFNHFPNNKELTMKSGLIENIRASVEHGNDFLSFFPRAYDLGHINQIPEFQEDFERTALVNLLKKHWQYIKAKADPGLILKAKEKFRMKQERKEQEKARVIDIFKKKKIMKVRNYQAEVARKDFVVHLSLLETAVNCARTFVHQHQNIAEADTFFALSQLNGKTKAALLAYSQFSGSYDEISSSQKKSLFNGEDQWQTPNELLIYKLYKLKELIKKFLPQNYMDGTENIWIIKPSGNARGSGIFLTDSLEEAIDSGAKNQARIIQKYIERPLIIKDSIYPNLNNKKFDIRQWVLVSSMNPLVIYMFSSSYIRLCSQRFELKDIKNNFKHLTNFSLNKGNFNNNVDDSVCHIDLLKQHLKASQGIEWDAQVKPKIEDIIIKTIASAADSIEQRPGCFDMYGFDLLLDDKCHPWLLEVNLSPACTERTPWLIEMLDQMAEGLLKTVLPSDYLQGAPQLQQAAAAANVEEGGENLEKKSEEPVEIKPVYNWELI